MQAGVGVAAGELIDAIPPIHGMVGKPRQRPRRLYADAARTSEVHKGQPSGVVMTWMFPPWLACLPDHHRSIPSVGPEVRHRSVSIRVPSMPTWLYPAIFAAGNAGSRAGACAAGGRLPHPSGAGVRGWPGGMINLMLASSGVFEPDRGKTDSISRFAVH